jgi:hypothetical protein
MGNHLLVLLQAMALVLSEFVGCLSASSEVLSLSIDIAMLCLYHSIGQLIMIMISQVKWTEVGDSHDYLTINKR